MNDVDWSLLAVRADIPRQVGRTTALAEACKKINGVLVVHHSEEAKRVARDFCVKACILEELFRLRGVKVPAVLDSTAVMSLAFEHMREVEEYEKKLRQLEQQIEGVKKCLEQ